MKTIDGKRIEELRIGQDVWMEETGYALYKIRDLSASKGYRVKVFGLSAWLKIDKISTAKPRKKVKKMLCCYKSEIDGGLSWVLSESVNDRGWKRFPENDFEAELFEQE